MIGHVPGGLGQVCIIANVIFSGMSGSAIADAAGIGQVMHKAMVDNGYQTQNLRSPDGCSLNDRPDHSSQHPLRPLRGIDRRVGRQAFPGRIYSGILMAIAMMIALALHGKTPRSAQREEGESQGNMEEHESGIPACW